MFECILIVSVIWEPVGNMALSVWKDYWLDLHPRQDLFFYAIEYMSLPLRIMEKKEWSVPLEILDEETTKSHVKSAIKYMNDHWIFTK